MMIAVRLSDDYERRFEEIARKAGTKSGPFARQVLMAFIDGQENRDAAMLGKLTRIEDQIPKLTRSVRRLEGKVDAFLEEAEITEPD